MAKRRRSSGGEQGIKISLKQTKFQKTKTLSAKNF